MSPPPWIIRSSVPDGLELLLEPPAFTAIAEGATNETIFELAPLGGERGASGILWWNWTAPTITELHLKIGDTVRPDPFRLMSRNKTPGFPEETGSLTRRLC